MKKLALALSLALFSVTSFAGVRVYNGTTDLKVFSTLKCGTGMSCVAVDHDHKLEMDLASVTGAPTRFTSFKVASALTSQGTSVTGSATVAYVSQFYVPISTTLTGIAILNGITVGTDKYIVALADSSGAIVANSAVAGTLSSGASSWQQIAFTATYSVKGPGAYWVVIYKNGTTDNFQAIPASGAYAGLAGSVSGQTFGTLATLTLPTTFTADLGPIFYTY